MNLQPTLQNSRIRIEPLRVEHFDAVFAAASDPLVWAQHPNPNRYRRPDFETYFRGAMESKGALYVQDLDSKECAGCTRFYDLNPAEGYVLIGYTFLARKYWGGLVNPSLKKLMLDHAFYSLLSVRFQVGANNRRSQIAMTRLGATQRAQIEVAYFGEPPQLNYEYEISKHAWLAHSALVKPSGDAGS
jgi:N-acetyltransferase